MPRHDRPVMTDLKLRLRKELRDRIERAASEQGISMNAEIVRRLEQTVRDETQAPQILELAYGRKQAGILLAVAKGMAEAGQRTLRREQPNGPVLQDWTDDAKAFEEGVLAALAILSSIHAERRESSFDLVTPNGVIMLKSSGEGAMVGSQIVAAIRDGASDWAIARRFQIFGEPIPDASGGSDATAQAGRQPKRSRTGSRRPEHNNE